MEIENKERHTERQLRNKEKSKPRDNLGNDSYLGPDNFTLAPVILHPQIQTLDCSWSMGAVHKAGNAFALGKVPEVPKKFLMAVDFETYIHASEDNMPQLVEISVGFTPLARQARQLFHLNTKHTGLDI